MRLLLAGGEAVSVTVTVTVKVPLTVGVPEIAPVTGSIDMPVGRPVALHV